MNRPTDPDLIARCLEGEEQAWIALTERYADIVFRVARRCGLDAADAGDVVQEVFMALLKSMKRLTRRERLLAWILKTAQRESWRQVRRRRQARAREEQVARPEKAPTRLPSTELTQLEDQHAVREAYGAIGERCRRLLDALFLSGTKRSYAKISAELGIPVGSIGPTRQRCLTELRKALDALGFLPPDADGPTTGKTR